MKYWRDVRLSVFAFALYIFFSPLDLILNFNGMGTVLKFLGLIIIGISTIELFREHSPLPARKEYLAALIYSLYYLASLTWSYYEPNIALVFTILNLALFFIITTIRPFTEKEYAIIVLSSIFGVVTFSTIMIMNSNTMLYLKRVTILFGDKIIDPNDMGANFILPLFLCMDFLRKPLNHWLKTVFLLFIFLIGFAVILTGSRGALFAIIVGFIFYILFNNHISIKKKSLWIILSAVSCVLLYFLISGYLPEVVKARLTIRSILEDKGSDRLILWNDAMNIFVNSDIFRIVFGYGLANFPFIHENNYALLIGTHNLFIQNLIEGGLVALALLFLLLFYVLKGVIKKRDWVAASILIATIIVSCFLETVCKKFFWNALIFASVHVISKNSTGPNMGGQFRK